MKTSVTWQEGVHFVGTTDTGHDIHMDGSPDRGGQNKGARPMALLLTGLGGCASFDVVTILKKARQDITDVVCELDAERADSVPAVFTDIHLHFVVTGRGLKEAQVKRAVELSADKYCSASKMLSAGGVSITHDYEICDYAD